MFIQTEKTPNPNSLKFIPGKRVLTEGNIEILEKNQIDNELVKNIFSIDGVESIFLSEDFLSVNKREEIKWENLIYIIKSYINDYYSSGKEITIDQYNKSSAKYDLDDIEKKIIKILDTKIRPAVARDGGDIKFQEFSNGIVKVKLQGSCSGCPSSTMTLKQGVQNLLCHYIPEVKEVLAI